MLLGAKSTKKVGDRTPLVEKPCGSAGGSLASTREARRRPAGSNFGISLVDPKDGSTAVTLVRLGLRAVGIFTESRSQACPTSSRCKSPDRFLHAHCGDGNGGRDARGATGASRMFRPQPRQPSSGVSPAAWRAAASITSSQTWEVRSPLEAIKARSEACPGAGYAGSVQQPRARPDAQQPARHQH